MPVQVDNLICEQIGRWHDAEHTDPARHISPLPHYLGLLHRSQNTLAEAFRQVASAHADEADIVHLCRQQAQRCDERARRLSPFADRYAEDAPDEPERLHSELFRGTRTGGLGLLRDLQDLYLMTAECDICWTMVSQAAQGLRDTAPRRSRIAPPRPPCNSPGCVRG